MFPSCWVMIAPTASGPDGWILQSPFSRPSLPPYVRSDNDCRLDSIPFQNICRVSRISKVSSHPAHSTITSTAHQEYINIYIYIISYHIRTNIIFRLMSVLRLSILCDNERKPTWACGASDSRLTKAPIQLKGCGCDDMRHHFRKNN